MQKKSENKILNQKFKAILTLIGDILMNIIIGNSLIWLYLPEKLNIHLDSKPNLNIPSTNPHNKIPKLIISLILTFSNISKLYFTMFTKYTYIRKYIICSLGLIIISHLLLYMLEIKYTSMVSFILYGIGIGFPFHQLVINTNLHFINNKFYIILINKICYHISPLLYITFFSYYGNSFSPIGGEIIIFYLVLLIICTAISFDYLRDCRNEKIESNEQNLLIKKELEFSISDMTDNTTERGSNHSDNSIRLEKNEKIFLNENENINRVFISRRQSIISVFSNKNFYLIILFYSSANFLTWEKIFMLKSNDILLFLSIIFIANIIIYIIFSKTQMPPLLLKLIPLFTHILIIIYHTSNSRKENFSNKIELFLVSLSYTFQLNVPLYLMKKIYGEKNAVFFSCLLINLSTLSIWIFLFVESVRNSLRILIALFMILLVLFINTDAFNFNEDNKRKNLGIELEEKDDESKNEEKENEVEDVCDIADVKSDIEE